MISEYLEHVDDRAGMGVPPLALTAEQTTGLCELLQAPPAEHEALLVELLEERIAPGVDPAARVKADFLNKVGQAFAGLGFWNRAIRVYRYMLAVYKGRPGEDKALLALIAALYNKEDYKQLEDAADTYLQKFPKGKDRARIFYLLVSSLHKSGQTEKAASLLEKKKFPVNHDLNSLGGRIFWQLKKYDRVEKYLARIMGKDLRKVEADEILIRAEALFLRGHLRKALPFYQYLTDQENYADQALYRSAQIHLETGRQDEGLNILQNLSEKGISTLWRKMAAESYEINRFIQASTD